MQCWKLVRWKVENSTNPSPELRPLSVNDVINVTIVSQGVGTSSSKGEELDIRRRPRIWQYNTLRVRELTFQTCSYNFKIVKFCTWWPVLPASQVSLDWSTGRRFLSSPHPSSTSISAESPARAPIGRPASRDRATSSDWCREKQITETLRRSSRNIYLWNSFDIETNAPFNLSYICTYIYIYF